MTASVSRLPRAAAALAALVVLPLATLTATPATAAPGDLDISVTVPSATTAPGTGDPFTVSNASFRWGINAEAGSGAFFGGCNFLSAGVVGDTQAYERENTTFSNLTNLSVAFATGAIGHTLAAGLELSREESDALRFGTSVPPTTHVLAPDYRRATAGMPAAQ